MGLDLTGIGSVADVAKGVIDRLWPNKNDPAYIAAQAKLIEVQTSGALKAMDDQFQLLLAQAQANTAEAAQSGLHFRDGAGWVCVAGFGIALFRPLIEWGAVIAGHPVSLPAMDTTTINDMLMGLLGLGTMHVYQQVKS